MGWLRNILRHSVWIFIIIGSVALVSLIRCFAFTSCIIPTDGMAPALCNGDRIIVNLWSYGLRQPFLSLFDYSRLAEKKPGYGDVIVFNNPLSSAEQIDRRELFISRCIARPGDTVIVDSAYSLVSAADWKFTRLDHDYSIPKERLPELDSLIALLNIPVDSIRELDSLHYVRNFDHPSYTKLEEALDTALWIAPVDSGVKQRLRYLVVPGKNVPVEVTRWNRTLLMNTLNMHEGCDASISGDTLYVDGEAVSTCHFTKDYYWMMSDYMRNTNDSRLFGFLPHDHILGCASFIWFSKDPKRGPLSGYRYRRFFKRCR